MEKHALDFLLQYSNWIKDANFFSFIGHWLVMAAIKGVYRVASFAESIVDQVFKITGFLEDGIIGEIYNSMRILSVTILMVILVFIFYKFMFSDRVNLKDSLLRGIVFLCVITQLPGVINQGLSITKETFDATKDIHGEEMSLSYSIIRNNMVDLNYLSRNGFELLDNSDSTNVTMNLSEQAYLNTDMTEIILPSDVKALKKQAASEKNTEALSYELETAEDGTMSAKKIKNGWFTMFDNGKFRFKANTGTILISLCTMTVIFLSSAYTIAVSIIELLFTKILFPILAVSDIETGQRVKKILQDIGNTFVIIMLTGLTMSIFGIYFSYLATMDLNILSYTVLCVVGIQMSLAGPKTFGRYLGIDTDSRSGLQSLKRGYYEVKSLTNLGKAATSELNKSTAQSVVNGVSGFENNNQTMTREKSISKSYSLASDDKLDPLMPDKIKTDAARKKDQRKYQEATENLTAKNRREEDIQHLTEGTRDQTKPKNKSYPNSEFFGDDVILNNSNQELSKKDLCYQKNGAVENRFDPIQKEQQICQKLEGEKQQRAITQQVEDVPSKTVKQTVSTKEEKQSIKNPQDDDASQQSLNQRQLNERQQEVHSTIHLSPKKRKIDKTRGEEKPVTNEQLSNLNRLNAIDQGNGRIRIFPSEKLLQLQGQSKNQCRMPKRTILQQSKSVKDMQPTTGFFETQCKKNSFEQANAGLKNIKAEDYFEKKENNYE